MKDPLARLQDWYTEQCNGDWEHQYGVRIDTIDNPGWSIEVDVVGTSLHDKEFSESKVERSQFDWTHCRVREGKFEGFGGPGNLKNIIEVFLAWMESQSRAHAGSPQH